MLLKATLPMALVNGSNSPNIVIWHFLLMNHYSPYEDKTDDYFYQSGNFYRLMTEDKQ
ncbi:hypothetical protein [Bacteroides helcogenes]|nr:hypothetical protein [Bacteroides helcogenes]MDY5238407.1 hypothetical protein [Bacteroides helcogenes]